LIACYGFFAMFALLLLLTTVLVFVPQGSQAAENAVIHSALGQFPIIGSQLQAHSLSGSGIALVVGIAGTLLAGLGVTMAGENVVNQVYAVPQRERPKFLRVDQSRGRPAIRRSRDGYESAAGSPIGSSCTRTSGKEKSKCRPESLGR
jgi:uncharacterized BrkB/YihY/UPF0761 family membrane protein